MNSDSFQYNFQKGFITLAVTFFGLGLLSVISLSISTLSSFFFLFSGVFAQIWISGYFLYFYLKWAAKKQQQVKPIYLVSLLMGAIGLLLSLGIIALLSMQFVVLF
jgi:hypothetical protein